MPRRRTHPFHDVQTSKRADKVDSAQDNLSDEAVANTNALENGGAVVEEVIGTR